MKHRNCTYNSPHKKQGCHSNHKIQKKSFQKQLFSPRFDIAYSDKIKARQMLQQTMTENCYKIHNKIDKHSCNAYQIEKAILIALWWKKTKTTKALAMTFCNKNNVINLEQNYVFDNLCNKLRYSGWVDNSEQYCKRFFFTLKLNLKKNAIMSEICIDTIVKDITDAYLIALCPEYIFAEMRYTEFNLSKAAILFLMSFHQASVALADGKTFKQTLEMVPSLVSNVDHYLLAIKHWRLHTCYSPVL